MSLTLFNAAAVQDRSEFVSKVYTLLGVSLVFCCAGAYFGLSMPPSLLLPVVIAEFILMFICRAVERSFPLNLMLLFAFTTISGLTLGFLLEIYIAHGMGSIIPVATASTAAVFGGLSIYVHISKQDFSFLGGFLFMGLIGMLVVGLASMFFHLPLTGTVFSIFGVLLFSGFILYDTSNLLHRYDDHQYVAATLGLYLDIVNLFLFILRLLSNRR